MFQKVKNIYVLVLMIWHIIDITNSISLSYDDTPDSKINGANMGSTWVLSVPDGPHVGPMNLAIWDYT